MSKLAFTFSQVEILFSNSEGQDQPAHAQAGLDLRSSHIAFCRVFFALHFSSSFKFFSINKGNIHITLSTHIALETEHITNPLKQNLITPISAIFWNVLGDILLARLELSLTFDWQYAACLW